VKMKPGHLVRLFPRTWRARYGAEFEALLESSHLTRPEVLDILRHAAVEWIATTITGRVVLGVLLSSLATGVALALAILAPQAAFAGQQLWTLEFSALFALVMLAMACRYTWCVVTCTRTVGREQIFWIVATFVSSTLAQWGQIVGWPYGGSPRVPTLWVVAAVFMTTNCMDTLAISRIIPRGQTPVRLRQRPPARPLGLA
jgi:hypothetical protein